MPLEIKNCVQFIVQKEKFTYKFEIPAGALYGEAFDACYECLHNLHESQKKAMDSLKADKGLLGGGDE
jgi:hypothetical protein